MYPLFLTIVINHFCLFLAITLYTLIVIFLHFSLAKASSFPNLKDSFRLFFFFKYAYKLIIGFRYWVCACYANGLLLLQSKLVFTRALFLFKILLQRNSFLPGLNLFSTHWEYLNIIIMLGIANQGTLKHLETAEYTSSCLYTSALLIRSFFFKFSCLWHCCRTNNLSLYVALTYCHQDYHLKYYIIMSILLNFQGIFVFKWN